MTMGVHHVTPSRRTGDGSNLGTTSGAKEIQFVVIESSTSESKWCQFYFELLQHVSQWACMWLHPSACVDTCVHRADGQTRGSASYQISKVVHPQDHNTNVWSSGVTRVNGCSSDQGSAQENDRVADNRESSLPSAQGNGASSNEGAKGTSSGSLFFHHAFDEHAEDSDNESFHSCEEPLQLTPSVVVRRSSTWCTAKSGAKWPKPRKRRRGISKGAPARSPRQANEKCEITKGVWEKCNFWKQQTSTENDTSSLCSALDDQLLTTPAGKASGHEHVPFGLWETCDWCSTVGLCKVTQDEEVVCIDCCKQAASSEDETASFDRTSEAWLAMCYMCGEAAVSHEVLGMPFCRSCQEFEARISSTTTAVNDMAEEADCLLPEGCERCGADGQGYGVLIGGKLLCRRCGREVELDKNGGSSYDDDKDAWHESLLKESFGDWAPSGNNLVRLCGLSRAVHLNGAVGKLVRWHSQAMRWEVCLSDDGTTKMVKPDNFQHLDPVDESDSLCAACTP